ncbi:hypothetical protein SPAN111604_13800 [Sphingomonas antarctica]|uniref:hypothetical protein n=1 Tax=Sphingomonas antarctica TaxID=2040274 RepID=UPI0039EC6222
MILTLLALAAATPEPANPKDRVKCVREDLIGSLVQVRKVCHTVAEWEQVNRARAENARDVVHDTQVSQSNGGG